MNRSKAVMAITPVLTKDVSFSEKVESVDTALKSRAAVQREIKLKWAAVVQVFNKYEVTPPNRRLDAGQAAVLVQGITVYRPKPEVAEDLRAIVVHGNSYSLTNLAERPELLRLVEPKVPGLRKFLDAFLEAKNIISQPLVEDKPKTKEARAELQEAVNAYIQVLEAYDETVESVASVKEYIGIMKDIADISAIAQGIKPKE